MNHIELWMAQNEDGKCNLFNEKPVCINGYYFYHPEYIYNHMPMYIGINLMGKGLKEPIKVKVLSIE